MGSFTRVAASDSHQLDEACAAFVKGFATLPGSENFAPTPNLESVAAASPARQVEVTGEEIGQAIAALESFYVQIYGKDYPKERAPRSRDLLVNSLRSLLQLYRYSPSSMIPSSVSLAIQEKGSEKQQRIKLKLDRIRTLQSALGPNVEFLTPDTLAALKVFSTIRAARSKLGSGVVHGALTELSDTVRSNFDALLRSVGRAAVLDQALRELLFEVVRLVNSSQLKLTTKALKDACEELLVVSFTTGSPALSPGSLSTLSSVTTEHWGWLGKPVLQKQSDRAKLFRLIETVRIAQTRLYEPVAEFVEGFAEARIAFNTSSLMTRPNAFSGIPLGHPFHELYPKLQTHPNVLQLGLRAYGSMESDGGKYRFLSLRLGQLVESEMDALNVMEKRGEEAASSMLLGFLINDARMSDVLNRGWEFRLDQTIRLLEEERKARRLGIVAPIVGLIMGNAAKRTGLSQELLSKIAPEKLGPYLISQIESGGQLGPIDFSAERAVPDGGVDASQNASVPVPGKTTERYRNVEKLPGNLKNFVIDGSFLRPWEKRTRAEIASAENSPFFLFLDGPDYRLTMPTPPQGAAQDESRSDVALHFRKVLRDLDSRALAILEWGDQSIQREKVETGVLDSMKVNRLSQDVKELLDVFHIFVASPFYEAMREAGVNVENSEETLAWYVLNYAPNLAMYIMIGPPGAPNMRPPAIPSLAGLSWRIGIMSLRTTYGDGSLETPIYTSSPAEDPQTKTYFNRRRIAVSIAGGAVALAASYFSWAHWDEVVEFFRHAPTTQGAPAEPRQSDSARVSNEDQ